MCFVGSLPGLAQSHCKAPERPKPCKGSPSRFELSRQLCFALGLAVVAAEGTRPRLSLKKGASCALARALPKSSPLSSEARATAGAVRAIVCQQNAREPTRGQGSQEPESKGAPYVTEQRRAQSGPKAQFSSGLRAVE